MGLKDKFSALNVLSDTHKLIYLEITGQSFMILWHYPADNANDFD